MKLYGTGQTHLEIEEVWDWKQEESVVNLVGNRGETIPLRYIHGGNMLRIPVLIQGLRVTAIVDTAPEVTYNEVEKHFI